MKQKRRGFPSSLPFSMTRGPRLQVQQLPREHAHLEDGPYKAQPTSSPFFSPTLKTTPSLASSPPPLPNPSPTQIPLPRAAAAAMPFTPGPYSGVSTLALVSSLLRPPLLPEDSCPGDASRSDLTLPHLASSSCLRRWRGRRPSASASSTGASSSPSSR